MNLIRLKTTNIDRRIVNRGGLSAEYRGTHNISESSILI